MDAKLSRTGPSINKGHSKQDYQTPKAFMEVVIARFGMIAHDLAADKDNAQSQISFFSKEEDSLGHDWNGLSGNLWLNPPFSDITPWAKKCSEYTGEGRILFLVPASVGSNWFHNYVNGKAFVLGVNPRLTFVGCSTPYPKDLILAVYGGGVHGFTTWRWK